MRSFIISLNGRLQILFILGGTIFLSFIIASVVGVLFSSHAMNANIDLISSVYEVMGTIYAILLTFTLWGVWQNFTEAETCVENEAYSLLNLIYFLKFSPSFKISNLHHAAQDYIQFVIEKEWKTLNRLTSSSINIHGVTCPITMKVIDAVQNFEPKNDRDTVIFEQALVSLKNWLDTRRTRILIARGNSAKALWPLLFTGAFILFAFHGLFVMNSFGIWAALLLGSSFIIGLTFYLIFTLDCPFDGSLSIDLEPFEFAKSLLTTM